MIGQKRQRPLGDDVDSEDEPIVLYGPAGVPTMRGAQSDVTEFAGATGALAAAAAAEGTKPSAPKKSRKAAKVPQLPLLLVG